MNGNRKRPDPGTKVFNKSAATAPTAVLKVRNPQMCIRDRSAIFLEDLPNIKFLKLLLNFSNIMFVYLEIHTIDLDIICYI